MCGMAIGWLFGTVVGPTLEELFFGFCHLVAFRRMEACAELRVGKKEEGINDCFVLIRIVNGVILACFWS